jgi:hypothetical protein
MTPSLPMKENTRLLKRKANWKEKRRMKEENRLQRQKLFLNSPLTQMRHFNEVYSQTMKLSELEKEEYTLKGRRGYISRNGFWGIRILVVWFRISLLFTPIVV